MDNRFLPMYIATVSAWLLYAVDEFRLRTHAPPQPRVLLGFAIVLTGVTAIAVRRLFFRFRYLNRGERGELKVAETLEELRACGYRPVHDISGKGFNIDHVIVGPGGVFVIETKFRSGSGEIQFRNGEGLFVGGRLEEKDCLKQARANARDVNRLIQESCGRYEPVTPVVVFVGDWRVKDQWRDTDARVFTPTSLKRYIETQQPLLKRSEIELIATHLERETKS